jgi:lipoprotein-releasing system permease protein
LLGLLLAWKITPIVAFLQRISGVMLVDPRVYFIAELPSEIRAGDVTLIAGVALALGVLATLYPAWRAANTQPAESLRHEV